MGLFRRREARSASAPSAMPPQDVRETVALSDPGLSEDDPRQLLYALAESMGLSVALWADVPVETLLATASRVAPELTRSTHRRLGFQQLDSDEAVFWVAVEGLGGSAVIVFCGPETNSSNVTASVLTPFESAGPPYRRELIVRGSTDPALRDLIESADVIPVWTEPAFHAVGTAEAGLPTLTAPLRRSLSSWERLQPELYKRSFTDQEGDSVDVFAGLWNEVPLLFTTVGESADGMLEPFDWVSVGAGHDLLWLDPAVTATTRLAPSSTPDDVLDAGQRFVDSLTHAYRDRVTGLQDDRDAASTDSSLWDVLETRPSADAAPSRSVDRADAGRFHHTERIRENLPDGGSVFDVLDRLAHQLREQRGNGFEHSWRSASDAPMLPSTTTASSAVLHEESGRFLAIGHPTHENWGSPPAHDLGAIDGRNAFSFAEAGHPGGLFHPVPRLYAGSFRTGAMTVVDATIDAGSVDYHAASETAAVLAFLGSSTGAVYLYDRTGSRRLLTVVHEYSGADPLRFSGDGRWLLVTSTRQTRLIEVATGRLLTVDVGNAGWWPGTTSTLLTVEHTDGLAVPRLYDVNTGEHVRDFPALTPDTIVNPEFPFFWHPAASPDGSEMLTLSPAGVDSAHQHAHGSGDRLFVTELATGVTRLVHGVFADDDRLLERDVREARWSEQPWSALEPTAEVSSRMQEPVTEHEYLAPGRWGAENEQFVVALLNQAIAVTQSGGDPSPLVPDILASLRAAGEDDTVWANQAEWLTGLSAATAAAIVAGSIRGRAALAWRRIGSAVGFCVDRRPDRIDSVSAVWTG
ncbi:MULTISPECIES: hypothetical protein [unclassified Rathayibacter]|uniref:hypothetical protein n=1 Tax=unclassified Rathayibacter TaxID=2609250 RepID=UPI0006F56161|nr:MULTISPECIES: hypothetical protein [unclassified Rathayibacter]KQQ06226.1 hypothetical protein ASF42_06860 [Rathayibacter sp. Leaf294]KQS14082.1 hypothetical protein ASG06_06865 [Rathayibacter sp. Leaf185]